MFQAEQIKGCCPLDCPDSCAWVTHVEDGRVVRVQGARERPVTRGALGAKGHDYQQRTYAADRLLHAPTYRGEGRWVVCPHELG